MSFAHAVLALIAERRGYGYELAHRFEERVGPAWRLNPSAVYPALDQLERGGLATSAARRANAERSPRVVYAATSAGVAALDAWLGAAPPRPEPMRSELHLRLAFAQRRHQAAWAAQLEAHGRACEELLARYPRAMTSAGPTLVDAAVVGRLRAELAWLAHARGKIGTEG